MQAMRRDLVPIVSPLLNFARDRARRLPLEQAFPVLPDSMAIHEAQYHLARKGLPHLTVKCLKEVVDGKDAVLAQQASHASMLKSPHIIGLFCPYSRSLLTRVWSAQAQALLSNSLETSSAPENNFRLEWEGILTSGYSMPSAACRRVGVRCKFSKKQM
jgi:hypothetical protein